MLPDYYRKAKNYEVFIRKAYNCDKGKRFGADESLMLNIFLNELKIKGNKQQRIPPSRQLFKVKLYMEKALIKLKKRKKYINSYEHFTPLLLKLNKAANAEDLTKIVSQSLKKIIELDNQIIRRG